ncbi:hypothetical protein [Enterobacter mori]|uniref:hypothetical protein n=1 Tax=Enterobacter mori TaxID=539813 RepID=UPI00163D372B|nr:hypothetical protein [Enterobacter mori]MCC8229802.1 hypothetical protein [Enterobacter mori]MCC8239352.1 hypothetical protein [Enterobacter mori]
MVNKLKQRRLRRLKADIVWWMAEAQDWKQIAMEHAAEIDRLRKMVIRVPMPVVVPADITHGINVQGAFAMGIERYGDAMQKLADSGD